MTTVNSPTANTAELEAELERYRRRLALYDAAGLAAKIGHYEWNYVDDCLESCSEEYARIFDMSVDEALAAQSDWESTIVAVHPDDRELYRRGYAQLRDDGELDAVYRIVLPGGQTRHLREYGTVMRDDAGKPVGCFGIIQDITQQVRHESDLEYRDELARQAESITDIGHFIYDENRDRYIYISDGMARIYGTSPEAYMQAVQSSEDDLADIVDEDRARVREEYDRYMETGEDCAIEYRIRRADGRIRWIRELTTAKRREEGRVSQTLGVVQDITDRIEREQELVFKDTIASQAEALIEFGYFLFNERENRHLYVSPGQARILGMEVDEFHRKIVSNEDYFAYVHEDDRPMVQKVYFEDVHGDDGYHIEYRVCRPDGEIRWVVEIGQNYTSDDEGVIESIGVVQDITERMQTEQELKFRDALATQAEAITDIGHFVYDEIKQRYLFASPGLARIHGLDDETLLTRAISWDGDLVMVHPEDRERVKKVYDEFLVRGGDWQVEYRLICADGETRWVREIGQAHSMNHGIPQQTIGVLQDITAQKVAEQEIIDARDTLEQQVVERTRELANTVKQLEEEVEERKKIAAELDFLANHDALTGLPSLRLCKDRLAQSLAESRRNRQTSVVMFVDLDGFKNINDDHGHETGDQVLKAVADRIRHEIRETDTVARIGGDEFVIILTSLPEISIAERIAAGLIERVAEPIRIDADVFNVGASVGISLYPQHGTTAEELIRAADKAMYTVKRGGKNGFGFAPGEPHLEVVADNSATGAGDGHG